MMKTPRQLGQPAGALEPKEASDMDHMAFAPQVEQWDVFEVTVPGFADRNPFTDYQIRGVFCGSHESVSADGFYDGEGVYKVRFMPSFTGRYTFAIDGSFADCRYSGEFTVTPALPGNHGPVHVANTYHLAYADGTPYYSVGTTCYVWTHQAPEMQEKTLATLRKGYFNKIRFCVFPKHYDYNFREPLTYPYVGTPCDSSRINKENFARYKPDNPENKWDFQRFNPEHFRRFENRIRDLRDLGIEADLIIMHPYDRWGFSTMDAASDDLYWHYVIARFAAYRNVWWSLANEFDLMKKTLADWERYARIICTKDPYRHLRSIHNCFSFYDYAQPWVTHCSIQRMAVNKIVEKTDEWRLMYKKPVVIDEMCYEGNIDHDWGNITGQELVRRFWETTLRGGYAGHGETYVHPQDLLWWSHGGELHGESPERLRFLHRILSETPGHGLRLCAGESRTAVVDSPQDDRKYRLVYLGFGQPAFRRFYFDDSHDYAVEVIDTWEMTITPAGVHRGRFRIELPGKPYMAIRITRMDQPAASSTDESR